MEVIYHTLMDMAVCEAKTKEFTEAVLKVTRT